MAETALETQKQHNRALVIVKLAHTAIWAFFVLCILGLPLAAFLRRFDWALGLAVLVLLECCVLALNRGRCPLTNLAERFTEDRSPVSDIYLPVWLARWNKQIFGTLFVLGAIFTLWQWWRS